jgi:hypothetical protein
MNHRSRYTASRPTTTFNFASALLVEGTVLTSTADKFYGINRCKLSPTLPPIVPRIPDIDFKVIYIFLNIELFPF